MRVLWFFLRLLLLIIIFAPQLVALDLIIGLLMGASHGAIHLFDLWLEMFTRMTQWLKWPEIIAKVTIGIWSFAAFGLGAVRMFMRE